MTPDQEEITTLRAELAQCRLRVEELETQRFDLTVRVHALVTALEKIAASQDSGYMRNVARAAINGD